MKRHLFPFFFFFFLTFLSLKYWGLMIVISSSQKSAESMQRDADGHNPCLLVPWGSEFLGDGQVSVAVQIGVNFGWWVHAYGQWKQLWCPPRAHAGWDPLFSLHCHVKDLWAQQKAGRALQGG